jgi:hypothetical protein
LITSPSFYFFSTLKYLQLSFKISVPEATGFLMSGIFSALGIGVSVTIIAIGGGFSGSGSSITNPPAADLWRIGEKIKGDQVFLFRNMEPIQFLLLFLS